MAAGPSTPVTGAHSLRPLRKHPAVPASCVRRPVAASRENVSSEPAVPPAT